MFSTDIGTFSLVFLIFSANSIRQGLCEEASIPDIGSGSDEPTLPFYQPPSAPKIDVTESLRNYSIKFYKKRYVDGQNTVVAPILVFYVLMSLYDVTDPSTKFDLHTLVDIPQDVPVETMPLFEHLSEFYLRQAISNRSRVVARLYFSKSIGKIDQNLKRKNFTTVPTDFGDKQTFLSHVNGWMKSRFLQSSDDLVHEYNVGNDTVAFLAGASYFDWPSQMKLSTEEKFFQGNKVNFLEGNLQVLYGNLSDLSIDVLELNSAVLTKVKFWLILPNPQSSIKQFSERLDAETISKIESGIHEKMVNVALAVPKVSIEYNSQEDSYINEVFKVFTSLFTKPSVRLADGKKDLYPIKNFLVKCILRLSETETFAESLSNVPPTKLTFDRPFVMMMLTKNGSVPLFMANYFSTKNSLRELENEMKRLEALAHAENRSDL